FRQLGDGSDPIITPNRPYAAKIPTMYLSNAIGIAAGSYHSLALISAGTVKSWGRNNFGQLGNNSTTDSSIPVDVSTSDLSDATQVAAGGFHSVALRGNANGKLKAWGKGGDGQTANNSCVDTLVPTTMVDTLNVTFTGAGF